MPHWSNEPPEKANGQAFRIVRTPPAKPVNGIITCTDLVGCCTHFVKNRTVPCEGQDDCSWCDAGHSWRWHGYVSCVLTESFEHVLFECTAQASDTFKNYYNHYNTLRACKFKAHRPTGRLNGRVHIQCTHCDEMRTRLPDPLDVQRILCHIWNVRYGEAFDAGRVRQPARDIGVMPSDDDARYRP